MYYHITPLKCRKVIKNSDIFPFHCIFFLSRASILCFFILLPLMLQQFIIFVEGYYNLSITRYIFIWNTVWLVLPVTCQQVNNQQIADIKWEGALMTSCKNTICKKAVLGNWPLSGRYTGESRADTLTNLTQAHWRVSVRYTGECQSDTQINLQQTHWR